VDVGDIAWDIQLTQGNRNNFMGSLYSVYLSGRSVVMVVSILDWEGSGWSRESGFHAGPQAFYGCYDGGTLALRRLVSAVMVPGIIGAQCFV
jgi:hypothetical protein